MCAGGSLSFVSPALHKMELNCLNRRKVSDDFEVRVTRSTDDRAICGLERCQAAFVADHVAYYSKTYPDIQHHHWFKALACGGISTYIATGVVVLHVVRLATEEIVGYLSYSRSTPIEGSVEESPHIKINHVIVVPRYRGEGLGRLLFDEFFRHLFITMPDLEPDADIRIVVAEENTLALQWYWRLGFVAVQLQVQHLHAYHVDHPICYVKLQLRRGESCAPWSTFFGAECLGERLVLLPDFRMSTRAPPTARIKSLRIAAEKALANASSPTLSVCEFDDVTEHHVLEDGTRLNLTEKFAHGLVRFKQPLHVTLRTSTLVAHIEFQATPELVDGYVQNDRDLMPRRRLIRKARPRPAAKIRDSIPRSSGKVKRPLVEDLEPDILAADVAPGVRPRRAAAVAADFAIAAVAALERVPRRPPKTLEEEERRARLRPKNV